MFLARLPFQGNLHEPWKGPLAVKGPLAIFQLCLGFLVAAKLSVPTTEHTPGRDVHHRLVWPVEGHLTLDIPVSSLGAHHEGAFTAHEGVHGRCQGGFSTSFH